MDPARQVLRFSIPGSLFLLLTYGFIIGGRLLQHDGLAQVSAAVNRNVGAIVVILASIPVGFILYQFYYLSIQPFVRVGLRWGRRWPRIDRGARVLSVVLDIGEQERLNRLFGVEETLQSIAEEEDARNEDAEASQSARRQEDAPQQLLGGGPFNAENRGTVDVGGWLEWFGVQRLSPSFLKAWPEIDPDSPRKDKKKYAKAANAYADRWYVNWDVLRSLLDAACDFDGGAQLRAEYTLLSDVYHALGVCRTACTSAWLVSSMTVVAYVVADHHNSRTGGLYAILASGVVAALLWLVLNQTRRQTWKSAEMSLTYGLRFFLTRNPSFLDPEVGGE